MGQGESEAKTKKNRTRKRCTEASVEGMDKVNQRQGRRGIEKGRDAQRKVLRAWARRIRGKDEEK